MSLADQILKLSSTAPEISDSDDDFTAAKLIDKRDLGDDISDAEDDVNVKRSHLRVKSTVLLEDEDVRYKGKQTSRKTIHDDSDGAGEIHDATLEESSSEFGEDMDEDVEESSGANIEDENDSDNAPEEENIHRMQNMKHDDTLKSLSEGSDETRDDDDDESDEDDDDDENLSDDVGDVNLKPDMISGRDDVEKGKAVRAQLGLWDSMMEVRLKLRKVQTLVNRLPLDIVDGENVSEARKNADKAMLTLCNQLMFLQTCLLLQYPETKPVITGRVVQQEKQKSRKDDDEITSESEAEEDGERLNLTGMKRKLDNGAYPEFLAKRHSDFNKFRNSAIHKWNEKTNLASGKVKKSFGAFEQSTVKQIDQILSDKDRLIKRTQLNRSHVKVIGIDQSASNGGEIEADTTKEPSKNAEIFDDDDFYHQLLREVIERKSVRTDDPIALTRHWLELQKYRVKVKKVVDTKASKGRKIRYDVQSKLVNFMAANDTSTWTDEQRDELFNSLYGQRFAFSVHR